MDISILQINALMIRIAAFIWLFMAVGKVKKALVTLMS